MRRIVLLVLLLLSAWPLNATPACAQDGRKVDLILFYCEGCRYCAAMKQLLEAMEKKQPELRVRAYEVYFDKGNGRTFEQMAAAYQFEITGVPTAFLGNDVIPGYSPDMEPELNGMIEACIAQQCPSPLERIAASQRMRL